MSGFSIATPTGVLVVQARQLPDGSWVQLIEDAPSLWTPVGPPERLSVGTGAVVTLSPPGTATIAIIYVEANAIRYYDDGSNPTSGANGAPVPAGGVIQEALVSFANFKMISQSGTAIVHVLYYRVGS